MRVAYAEAADTAINGVDTIPFKKCRRVRRILCCFNSLELRLATLSKSMTESNRETALHINHFGDLVTAGLYVDCRTTKPLPPESNSRAIRKLSCPMADPGSLRV